MSEKSVKKISSWIWSAVVVCVMAGAIWFGIGIGRLSERSHMQRVLALQAENDGTTNVDLAEYAREMAAMEHYMAGNDKMLQTISFVRNFYVDPVQLDTIYEKAIPALLSELDPHSEYIPAKMFSAVNESLEG